MRRAFGATAANGIARQLVVPAHRAGGQAQFRRAQELLERTDAAVEQIAASCGMGTATTLRRRFRRALGVAPTTYRATFRLTDA